MGFATRARRSDLRKERMALQRLKWTPPSVAKMRALRAARRPASTCPFLYHPARRHLGDPPPDHPDPGPAGGADRRTWWSRTVQIAGKVLTEAKVSSDRVAGDRPGRWDDPDAWRCRRRCAVSSRQRPEQGRAPRGGGGAAGRRCRPMRCSALRPRCSCLDVTPQSLGVAIAGGYDRIAHPQEHHRSRPATTETFTPAADGQTTVKIMVLQGESDVAHENRAAGGVHPLRAPAGAPGRWRSRSPSRINSEGIVSVAVADKETGLEQIDHRHRLGRPDSGGLKSILEPSRRTRCSRPGPRPSAAQSAPRWPTCGAQEVSTSSPGCASSPADSEFRPRGAPPRGGGDLLARAAA